MRCFIILATRGSGVSASPETVPWKRAIRAAGWNNHAEVKAQFHDSDLVGEKTVFRIAKNRYRLIVFISFRTQIVSIREILAHRDYDKGAWKQ